MLTAYMCVTANRVLSLGTLILYFRYAPDTLVLLKYVCVFLIGSVIRSLINWLSQQFRDKELRRTPIQQKLTVSLKAIC